MVFTADIVLVCVDDTVTVADPTLKLKVVREKLREVVLVGLSDFERLISDV